MADISPAVKVFKNGGIVIFPTDTVFGIGCRVGEPNAIRKLYKIKKREGKKPSLILAASLKQVVMYVDLTAEAKILAKNFWPGPLTMVLKAKNNLPDSILGEDKTVGIRIPNLPYLIDTIEQVGEPILAPSANFSGEAPPTRLSEIDKNLAKLVDYVLKFDCGGSKPSTIIKMVGKEYYLLREGAIGKDRLFHQKGVKARQNIID